MPDVCATCEPPSDYVPLSPERAKALRGRCMVLLDGTDVTEHCMGADVEHGIVLTGEMDEDDVFVVSCRRGQSLHRLTYAHRGQVSIIELPEGHWPDEEQWRRERKAEQEAKIGAKILAREATCSIGSCDSPPEVVEFSDAYVTWLCYPHRNEMRDEAKHGAE